MHQFDAEGFSSEAKTFRVTIKIPRPAGVIDKLPEMIGRVNVRDRS